MRNMSRLNSRSKFPEIAAQSSRSRAIRFVLNQLLDPDHARLRAIEIGTMFKLDEGVSTWVIADAFSSRCCDWRLWSLDINEDHIRKSMALLQEHDPQLIGTNAIRWLQGPSLSTLPTVLTELSAGDETIDFALLDGGGSPEYNLLEFETLLPKMSVNFIILVDDFVWLKPTQAYPLPRPFGKAQAILTMFLCRHLFQVLYGQSHKAGNEDVPDYYRNSQLLCAMANSQELRSRLEILKAFDYLVLQSSMLAIAPHHLIDKLKISATATTQAGDIFQIRV